MTAEEVLAQLKSSVASDQEDLPPARGEGTALRGEGRGPQGASEEDQDGPRAGTRTLRERQLRRDVPRRTVADPARFTKSDLRKWAKGAYSHLPPGAWCPWPRPGRGSAANWPWSGSTALGVGRGRRLDHLCGRRRINPDADLDLAEIESLLGRVKDEIGSAEPRPVRDEHLRDRGRLLRRPAALEGEGDRQGDGHRRGGHGRHVVQGAERNRIHREGREDGSRRQESASTPDADGLLWDRPPGLSNLCPRCDAPRRNASSAAPRRPSARQGRAAERRKRHHTAERCDEGEFLFCLLCPLFSDFCSPSSVLCMLTAGEPSAAAAASGESPER